MQHERITVNPRVMVGKPVIRGTRLPVEQVLRELAGGMSFADILDAHPRLTVEDIHAALAYAADVVANEDIYLSEPNDAVLADENCDALVVRTLRALNHDVVYVAEETRSVDDDDILARTFREQRILITEDRDFCALVFRDRLPAYGIVLIRILPAQRARKADRIRALVNTHGDKLAGAMTVLTVSDARIRPLP